MVSRHTLKFVDNGYATVVKIIDFCVINFSLTWLIRESGKNETIVDISAAVIFGILFVLFGENTKLYELRLPMRVRRLIARFVMTALLTYITMFVVKHALNGMEGSAINNLKGSMYDIWIVSSILVLLSVRLIGLQLYRMFRRTKRVAIVGLTPAGLAIEQALLRDYRKKDVKIEFYDDRSEERFSYLIKSPFRGQVDGLIEKAKNNELDDVYIALPMVAKDRIRDYLDRLSDTTVDTSIVPDLYSYNLSVSQINTVGNVQTFSVFSSPFDGIGAVIKRIEDIIIGGAITILISPVLLFVALGVKFSSPGPILFKQDRYGLGGKKIKVWKFRSMKVMENSVVVTQATKNDPRVTKFGAFIRRTSLDELPQFFNVLQGTMSIVGPRPHAVAHNEQYRVIVDNYMIRHKIKPGITGWAQINGYRGETETVDKMEKRVQYDIQYMQEWSLWFDLKIIFLTVFKGFVSETAY
ncbi:undecaprenyl-phosphate glucose phosphotransferase [Vibrio sp. V39_P1S14PM300]|uniref:undecaprenyl-phosphate glucose phosphotransferase n=1 Tax=Vibrio sp. V39_P1S14PM300 TaxID=1938690 RepID=UPI0013728F59|nr:undecaprenyl-phosphate glucose phosphotransferase [Vibrio sp. V39_P1S14PM300]NAX21878.1 undecaprenyl-phosphate glucose phosphotransferase [Vibrio sp. V39_P1S14PM300]